MSNIAIRVEGLSKRYRIGAKQQRYKTFGETLGRAVRAPFRATRAFFRREGGNKDENIIWSLKDVSFEIKRGDVIGIVGRNGAGKSTLLKILSRITEPTEGYAKVSGRLGSLLEVGTGFHPELTGRENIYLNGAILGMRRNEIARKFDEIVAFAEVEEFIDTPVKHYSSGMGLRLGFSVAAHLELENLLVDEVLAVGDVAFQKKCMEKMSGISQTGKTILLVSHQLQSIRRLCSESIWLHEGKVMEFGNTAQILNTYENAMSLKQKAEATTSTDIAASGFMRWGIIGQDGKFVTDIEHCEDLTIQFDIAVKRVVHNGKFRIALQNADGLVLWGNAVTNITLEPGMYSFSYKFRYLPLKPGSYYFLCYFSDMYGWIDQWVATPALSINSLPINSVHLEQLGGVLNVPFDFQIREVSVSSF